MIYFKTIQLINPGKEQTEKALRKVALKSKTSLNKTSSKTNVGTDKLFIGFEDPNNITFSRIRYFVEGYMPKLIISISKKNDDNLLKFKLDFTTTCIFFGASFLFILILIAELSHQNWEDAAYIILFYTIFIGLILLEVKLTQRNIDKAVQKFQQENQ